MKTTVNKLRVELQAIQEAHLQLNSFFYGSPLRAVEEIQVRYPLMCSYYTGGGTIADNRENNTTGFNLVIVIADRVFKDYSNLNDTESDTLQVCRDIINIMVRSRRWNRIGRVQTATVEKFIDKWADEVTGHLLRINFTLFDSNALCGLPLVGYDFDETFKTTCAPVVIFNSTQTYTETIEAGGLLELPDVTNIDSDGTPVATPAQTPFTCSPALDVTVHNSDDSLEVSVPSGGDYEIPDTVVTVKDENDNTLAVESVPSGVPITIPVVITPPYHQMTIDFLTGAGIPNDGTVLYPSTPFEITGAEIWTAVETFVSINLERGILQKTVLAYLFIGGTSTAHRLNLIDTTKFIITWYGGVTHGARGPIFNGTNSFADTGAIDGIDFCLGANSNSVSIGYYSQVANPTSTPPHPFGTGSIAATGDGCIVQVANNPTADSYVCMRGTTYSSVKLGSQLGYNAFSRGTFYSQSVYQNDIGQNAEFLMNADTSVPLRYMVIGGINQGTFPNLNVGGYYDGPMSGFYISEYLTQSEHQDFAASWQALQTALHRNV